MISVTDRAAIEIRNIISEKDLGQVSLRIGVRGGGCSGFNYTLGFDSKRSDLDVVYTKKWKPKDIEIICDPKSFLYLNGTELDFEESLMARGFTFNNPKATKTCGCGDSFSV